MGVKGLTVFPCQGRLTLYCCQSFSNNEQLLLSTFTFSVFTTLVAPLNILEGILVTEVVKRLKMIGYFTSTIIARYSNVKHANNSI